MGWPASITWASRPLRKWQHGGAVAGGALGKEDDGQAFVGGGLDAAAGADCGAAAAALHVDGAGHGGHPAEDGTWPISALETKTQRCSAAKVMMSR